MGSEEKCPACGEEHRPAPPCAKCSHIKTSHRDLAGECLREGCACGAFMELKCWRCGDPIPADEDFGAALLVISYADQSFSGTFKVPLCTGCLTHTHRSGAERIL